MGETVDADRAMTSAERMARWRAKHPATVRARRATPEAKAARKAYKATPAGKTARHASEHRRRKRRVDDRPFVGIDGEGCGTDELGRQLYMLLRCGDRELYTGKPLGTAECLDFICDAPPRPILVGFSFGYDVTMILRDLSGERRARLLMDKSAEPGRSRYTYWGDFGIEYLPKNYLRVCRTVPRIIWRDGKKVDIRQRIEGSARTIYETFGFFQMSFLKSIQAFNVGKTHWARIERNKAARGGFTRITAEIRRYCAIECELLADMMEVFRRVCQDTGIRPRTWNGAGKLAGALHTQHETITAATVAGRVPAGVLGMARAAYYGGRFEVSHIGDVPGPIHEYDIRSAYPAMMTRLPCLEHGEWLPAKAGWLKSAPEDALFVARARFAHGAPEGGQPRTLCGLPIRQKTGRLCWPLEGNGVYWSAEIRSAERLGAKIYYRDRPNGGPEGEPAGWRYVCKCGCRPFDWVESLYTYRMSLGGALRGYPIKLGINALYGRLAQRIGNPRWANMIWAGLITAMTRAALNDAASQAGQGGAGVVMLATDALFSRVPLAVSLGDALGQWEAATHERLFVVQPGIYWGAKRPKTRGVPVSFFTDKTDGFEAVWARYAEQARAAHAGYVEPPVVSLPMTLFTGLKLAQARGKPDTAGIWKQADRHFRFDWKGKRGRGIWLTDRCCWTYPPAGGRDLHSMAHASDKGLLDLMDIGRDELDDQPDMVDLTPPWRDQ
jgi:hypothetical protein